MEVLDKGINGLSQALSTQGFRVDDEFDVFMTFARDGDPQKFQVAPNGSFAVFDDDDRLVTEGEGAEDLYRVLVARTVPVVDQRRRSRA